MGLNSINQKWRFAIASWKMQSCPGHPCWRCCSETLGKRTGVKPAITSVVKDKTFRTFRDESQIKHVGSSFPFSRSTSAPSSSSSRCYYHIKTVRDNEQPCWSWQWKQPVWDGADVGNIKHRQIRRTSLLVRSSGKNAEDIFFVLQETDDGSCLY